jgi:hypothetical protein
MLLKANSRDSIARCFIDVLVYVLLCKNTDNIQNHCYMLPINNVNCEQNEPKSCVSHSKALPLKSKTNSTIYEKTHISSVVSSGRYHVGKKGKNTHIPVLRVLDTRNRHPLRGKQYSPS